MFTAHPSTQCLDWGFNEPGVVEVAEGVVLGMSTTPLPPSNPSMHSWGHLAFDDWNPSWQQMFTVSQFHGSVGCVQFIAWQRPPARPGCTHNPG